MGGSSTTTDSSQQTASNQVTQLPPWINTAAQQNYAYAQNLATQPLQQYQGQLVANVGPQMQQAWNTAATGANAGADQYNASQAGYLGVLGSTPMNVTASQSALANPTTAAQSKLAAPVTAAQSGLSSLAGTNLSAYMNPYTQSVINATLPLMQQQNALNQNQIQNAANSSNAFGGSRQGIQQGVAQAQGALNIGQMAAGLNQANFAQAQAAGEFDVGQANQMGQFNAGQANQVNLADMAAANNMNQYNAGQLNQVGMYNQGQANQMGQFNAAAQNQAALANQAVQQNQQGLNLQAASGLGVLGQQAQLSQTRDFTEQQTAGALEQQQAQNEINAQIANYQQAWNYPYQNLGVLQSALGMTPYGQATQGQSTTQGTSTTTQSPGLAQAALGGVQTLGSLFGGGGPFGAMGAFAGASDRKLKTDIKHVGHHPAGVPIYSYRYKGDPKHYPKVVGPMAEDVAKIAPHAVAPIPGSGGKMAVNMGVLGALSPPSVGGMRPGLPPSRALAPMLRPTGPQLPQPSMGRGVGAGMRQGLGPMAPGPLSGPGVAGAIGALGAPMRGQPARRGKARPPPIRGALGG